MKKKLIVVTILLVLILTALVLSGCENEDEYKQDDKLRDSTNLDANNSKPQRANYLAYVIDEEFSIGEDVFIELSYGTRVTKQQIDLYPEENVTEPYELVISAISIEGVYDSQKISNAFQDITDDPSDISNSILIVENFYAENYAFPSDNEKVDTTKVILPQSLFTGNKGCVMVAMHFYHNNAGLTFFYAIENDKILLSKHKFE